MHATWLKHPVIQKRMFKLLYSYDVEAGNPVADNWSITRMARIGD